LSPEPRDKPAVDRERLANFERALARQRDAALADPAPSDDDEAKPERVFALMGGASRRGSWEPPSRVQVRCLMGGITLDFRDADLLEGTTVVDVRVMWGGVKILVPPDVHVESAGMGLMGGFEGPQHRAPDPATPTIRVEGFALMGGVEVKIRDPEEPAPTKAPA